MIKIDNIYLFELKIVNSSALKIHYIDPVGCLRFQAQGTICVFKKVDIYFTIFLPIDFKSSRPYHLSV